MNTRTFWGCASGLLLLTVISCARFALAGNGCCCQCGSLEYNKVCRLVCEDKKVTVTCWGYKEEDFCVHGCGERVCKHCEMVCDDCDDPKAPAHTPKKFTWSEWTPKGCPKIYTKTKLMKKTITKKVPTYKWVVEDLCAQCEADAPKVAPPASVELPPKPDAKGPAKSAK
ncbi:MAG: hypothetical protein NT069_25585 [Planctomycetota bacterium]|nr:hypothetical protein [Planctomycetota bacterium]